MSDPYSMLKDQYNRMDSPEEFEKLRTENERLREECQDALNYLNVYMSENKNMNSGRLRAIKVHLKKALEGK